MQLDQQCRGARVVDHAHHRLPRRRTLVAQRGADRLGTVRADLDTDRFDLPLTMRVGVATEVYESGSTRVSVGVDALSPSAGDQHVNLGAEVALLGGLVQLRGGYQELFMDQSPRSFTLGGGLRYAFGDLDVSADYAYEAFEYFDGVNRFAFALQF